MEENSDDEAHLDELFAQAKGKQPTESESMKVRRSLTLYQAVFGKDYWRATWFGIGYMFQY